jgi:uncharacterized BrkB/YihY/UPF0761 family membrane protein
MVPEFKEVPRVEYDYVLDEPKRTVKYGDNWGFVAIVLSVIAGVGFAAYVGVKSYEAGKSVYSSLGDVLFNALFAGVLGTVFTFACLATILVKSKSTWFKRTKVLPPTQVPRTIIENKQIAEHRCCIHCKHPAKALR